MALLELKFNVARDFPTPDYPGNTAVFAPKLRRRVATSDTVLISGKTREDVTAGSRNHPSIRGRIITIVHDKEDVWGSPIPSHPDIDMEQSDGPFIQLQFIIRRSELVISQCTLACSL